MATGDPNGAGGERVCLEERVCRNEREAGDDGSRRSEAGLEWLRGRIDELGLDLLTLLDERMEHGLLTLDLR